MDQTQAMTWAYGLFAPLDWGADCDAEMRRMTDLWNQLVEIDRKNTAAYRAVIDNALDPVIAGERDAVLAQLEELKEQKKKRHAQARKKVPTPDLDAMIGEARERYKALKGRFAEAKKSARERTKVSRRELETDRQTSAKTARQQSGCYWGNYNAVINSYDTARKKLLKDGGELHFRRFNYTGRLVNQIQGGLSLNGLFGRGRGSNQVQIRPATAEEWPKRRLHPLGHILIACVYTRTRKPRYVQWPFILHRPFPEGAIVKEVHITRRKNGPRRDEWAVSFSLAAPLSEQIPAGEACGMDIGWRRLNDGVRVATLINERNERDFVILPERIVSGFRHVDQLTARRDKRVNEAVAQLKTLPWNEAPPALGDIAKAMLGAPRLSARALVRLAALWKEHQWRRENYIHLHEILSGDPHDCDLRDWRESAGLRARLMRARRDHYRCESKRITVRYGLIGGEKLSIREMSTDENNPTPEPSRWYRKVAAPAEFLSCLKWAAKKNGASIHEHEGASTWICHACGHTQVPRDPAELLASCPHCGTVWDQDINAARNLLDAALASAPMMEKDGAALAGVLPATTTASGGRWARTKKAAAEHRQRSQ